MEAVKYKNEDNQLSDNTLEKLLSNQESKLSDLTLEDIQKQFVEDIKNGKSLTGEQGLFTNLMKIFLESALEGELENHLGYKSNSRSLDGNHRNGKTKKKVKSKYGELEIFTPRDRNGSFDPKIMPKRQTILTEDIDDKVLFMFSKGRSYEEINKEIKEFYGINISESSVGEITNKIIPKITEWQNRSLEDVYPFLWLDAIHYKVREDSKVVSKAVYVVIGLNKSGLKEVLGLYLSESEGASFWLQVLTDLNNRGVKDVLIACIDNLKGFAEAIKSVFPKSEIQICIIHQIRNSLKYISYKDSKEFIKDLKKVYKASSQELAEHNLLELSEKWEKKYPIVIKSWQYNWDKLNNYFKYPEEIRRIMYTTNIIENLNRQFRKVTKTKGAFVSEMALKKLLFMAMLDITKKWTQPVNNWSKIISHLAIIFKDRLDLELKF